MQQDEDEAIDLEKVKQFLGHEVANMQIAGFINHGHSIAITFKGEVIGYLRLQVDRRKKELMNEIWF